jgi:hypothetical protein
MTIFVTKYALKDGILQFDEATDLGGGMVRCDKDGCSYYLYGSQCHVTRIAAIEKAENMRANKIVSLKKQIEKLEAMQFN